MSAPAAATSNAPARGWWQTFLLLVLLGVLAAGTVLAVRGVDPAAAAESNCFRNSYDGFGVCISQSNTYCADWDAQHAAGLPYGAQVTDGSGALRGRWEWNNLVQHQVCGGWATFIQSWVDNRGSANPALYITGIA